jgi:hypothetical protein
MPRRLYGQSRRGFKSTFRKSGKVRATSRLSHSYLRKNSTGQRTNYSPGWNTFPKNISFHTIEPLSDVKRQNGVVAPVKTTSA